MDDSGLSIFLEGQADSSRTYWGGWEVRGAPWGVRKIRLLQRVPSGVEGKGESCFALSRRLATVFSSRSLEPFPVGLNLMGLTLYGYSESSDRCGVFGGQILHLLLVPGTRVVLRDMPTRDGSGSSSRLSAARAFSGRSLVPGATQPHQATLE